MKKTLAVLLSVIMLFGVMPFTAFAADSSEYDRAAVAANDEAYIDSLSAEQMATVILDWVDRQIATYTDDITASVAEGVLAGFDAFEASFLEEAVYSQIPVIDSLDDVIAYKDYLAELGGDFANLDAANLITREAAGSSLGFIYGVFRFMADNSEIFGKVFRWDEEVFDYGKVGEYILTLDTTDEDNKKIVDFYNDYLIGNDIQTKFIDWVAGQMNYTYATDAEGKRTETFDEIISNGILTWFAGLCKTNGILSEEGITALKAYDLRNTDIYTLVKSFVSLVQSDNQIKIDTYYNYLMDTVVRTLLKTALGQKAAVGAEATLPSGFETVYEDLALLEEISGGTVYYKDGDAYYQVTVAEGAVTACNALTWEEGFEVNLEPVYATITTGAERATAVKTYEPKSPEISIGAYASEKNQELAGAAGIEFTGTAVPAEVEALMTGTSTKLTDGFLLKVTQGTEEIASLDLSFEELEAQVKEMALTAAQTSVAGVLASQSLAEDLITVDAVNFEIVYDAWTTDDEFVCAVSAEDVTVTLGGSANAFVLSIAKAAVDTAVANAVGNIYDNPIATVVIDGLSGGGADYFGQAEALFGFLDTDFAIDADLLDIAADYDEYNGAVGQVNHILYGLVDMLLSDDGMAELALTDGGNENLTANLQKVCDKANAMMSAAEEILNDEGLQEMITALGIDLSALAAELPLDILYDIDFSSVEGLWVSVITLGLDIIDDNTNELIADIHAEIGELENLDAMAVAMTDYLLAKCIPDFNTAAAELKAKYTDVTAEFALTVPAETDASAVANGAAKDIIMTKLVDLLYEAAAEGVVLGNAIANDILADVKAETGMDMPTVAFRLKVEKSADWQTTLAGLVDRVYELADGIILACDNSYTDTFDKIAAVANAVLPLGSLASNCKSDNFAFDVNTVLGFIFDDGLNGNLDGFLGLFETAEKYDDVAVGCSVTEALIKASEHIVDAFFPDTVKAELYVNLEDYTAVSFTEITCQEYFTSAENDAVIASNNMDSLNALKENLVPAALRLVREAGILPFFAKCDQDHSAADLETVTEGGEAATCTEAGVEAIVKCAECGYIISGGEKIGALGHDLTTTVTKAATCTESGTKVTTCSRCDYEKEEVIAATGHSYGSWTQTKDPTCTEQGEKTRTCATCGDVETSAVAALGHSKKTTTTKNPTCTQQGSMTTVCTRCSTNLGTAAIPATGHSWYTESNPTCTQEGIKKCHNCSASEKIAVDSNAHTDSDKDNECDDCGKTIDNSFGAKIKAFFQRIINWFKNLFK